ncbi:probable arginine--tRNA ligase, mitochondrial isoform X2 [Anopheles stephensi]|uniref:probable arginine--tRNA ligase, mitochondrial isoform X2 n=1 Tax=Anopheles stephensi TaxID=30069 RepID=UPI001658B63B|nr:probable arginine--tRNA ligase, mitochondrial isoform X2 [Anopheles stephensi]
MAQVYRKLLSEKVSRIGGANFHIPMAALNFTYNKPSQTPELQVLAQYLGNKYDKASSPNGIELCGFGKGEHLINITTEMRSGKQWAKVSLDRTKLVQTVLASKPLTEQYNPASSETIVVEFSSPNIAKPFHAGHLRSTIIGNFVSNINEFLGNRVVRLNYLGDWGTQFGYLALGVQLKGLSPADIHNNPIKCLYEAYVHAYEAVRNDPKMHEVAMNIFSRMEQGTADDLHKWQEYRDYTVQELEELYRRLGVAFTGYEWESQYGVNKIRNVLEMMERYSILKDQTDGRKVVHLQHRTIPIVKSDGSGMYLLRDIAALLDRHDRFTFQKCFYVVENGQSDHFASLCDIAQLLQLPYANGIGHIKFGRIHGMSTRRGKVVFLKDILHEAQQLVREKQRDSPTTKTSSIDDPEVCDILGTSAVIINDLKQRRMKDYNFDWSKILRMEGDSGIKLQYTHCRLASLLQTQSSAEEILDIQCDGSSLMEPEALDLVCQLANFKPICYQAQETAEACILVAYLFRLCKSINLALKSLPVKQESDRKKREQRILLYSRAKLVLHTGLELLGLRPLNEM